MARIVIFPGTLKAGGAERVAVWLADALHRLGHEVCLATLAPCDGDFYRPEPGVSRATLNLAGSHRPLGRVPANIRRALALRQLLQSRRADAVVAFMTHESVLAVLATRGLAVRCVISERNAPWRRDPGRLWALARRLLYPRANAVVVQTRAVAEWFGTRGCKELLHVMPNAAHDRLASAGPAVTPPSSRALLLAVGSKPHQKGFDLLIDAFSAVASRHPGWDLAILGLDPAAPATTRLRSAISAHGIEHRVILPGRVGNVADWYARAQIFVLSSRFEGLPNVLIEAMGKGCACVATDCETGPAEIVNHGHDGLLIPPEDTRQLAAAIELLISDERLRNRLGDEAKNILTTLAPEFVLEKWCIALALPAPSGGTAASGMPEANFGTSVQTADRRA